MIIPDPKEKKKKYLKYFSFFCIGLIIGLAWLWYSTSTTYDGAFQIGYDYGSTEAARYTSFWIYKNCVHFSCETFTKENLGYNCGKALDFYTDSNSKYELDEKFNDPTTLLDKISISELEAVVIAEISCRLILYNETVEAPILETPNLTNILKVVGGIEEKEILPKN